MLIFLPLSLRDSTATKYKYFTSHPLTLSINATLETTVNELITKRTLHKFKTRITDYACIHYPSNLPSNRYDRLQYNFRNNENRNISYHCKRIYWPFGSNQNSNKTTLRGSNKSCQPETTLVSNAKILSKIA